MRFISVWSPAFSSSSPAYALLRTLPLTAHASLAFPAPPPPFLYIPPTNPCDQHGVTFSDALTTPAKCCTRSVFRLPRRICRHDAVSSARCIALASMCNACGTVTCTARSTLTHHDATTHHTHVCAAVRLPFGFAVAGFRVHGSYSILDTRYPFGLVYAGANNCGQTNQQVQ